MGVREKEFFTLLLLRAMSLLTIKVTGRWEEPQVAGKKALLFVLSEMKVGLYGRKLAQQQPSKQAEPELFSSRIVSSSE